MKVNVSFDNENQRFKIYNGDTIINANDVVINEIPIDEELSGNSANAVENRAVKNALDNQNGILNSAVKNIGNSINTINGRLNNIIVGGGFNIIDNFEFDWDPESLNYGYTLGISLPANTLVAVYIPQGVGIVQVSLNDPYNNIAFLGDNDHIGLGEQQIGYFYTGDVEDTDLFYFGSFYTYDHTFIENNFKIIVSMYNSELEDIRVDALGFTHASAGDSVRSIIEAIQTGKHLMILDWINNTNTNYTGSARVDQDIPLNTDIYITLPPQTTISFVDMGGLTTTLGDITAEDTQELVYNTGNDYNNQSIYINSNSLPYSDLIEAIKLYLEINVYLDEELKDIRTDYFGFKYDTAGDSVRSIIEIIETGKIDINKFINNWYESSSQYYMGVAIATHIRLPYNRDIDIILPPQTEITIHDSKDIETDLGDITATETQELKYTTYGKGVYPYYNITLVSDSLAYNDLIEAVKFSIDFNVYGLKDKASVIKDIVKGNNLTLSDSIDAPIVSINIMGKSTQNGTPTIDNPISIVDITSEEIEVTDGTNTQTADLDITLKGIPVSSGGNYTDNNGQEWICDTIETYADGTGKLIQRVKSITFNGSENWQDTTNNRIYFRNTAIPNSTSSTPTTLFSHFSLTTSQTAVGTNDNVYIVSAGNLTASPTQNGTRLTASEWQTYLSTHNATFYYVLSTPVETPLTANQIAELKLNTYYPTTNINSNADVIVEYVCDTKHYIDKKIAGA